jgi:hypothetical protein
MPQVDVAGPCALSSAEPESAFERVLRQAVEPALADVRHFLECQGGGLTVEHTADALRARLFAPRLLDGTAVVGFFPTDGGRSLLVHGSAFGCDGGLAGPLGELAVEGLDAGRVEHEVAKLVAELLERSSPA